MNKPIVSIITVVFNANKYIEQTIKSIINQTYNHIEYIVIDGGSTDGTLDIIEKYKNLIDYFVSEPDKGIADAMNKGLGHAHGEYIIFLHADDYFYDKDVIKKVFEQESIRTDIILCDILFGIKLQRKTSRGFNLWFNLKTGIYHQGAICHRNVFNQIGIFDKQFNIVMDYDFFLRAYLAGIKARKVNIILSVMRDSGISSRKKWSDLLIRFMEEKRVHYKNNKKFYFRFIYSIYWILYIPYRKLIYNLVN